MEFGILDSVLAIRNNSGIAHYSEMPIPNSSTSALYMLLARRQDSVTGGAEINFGGAREVYSYVNLRGARGHEKFIPV